MEALEIQLHTFLNSTTDRVERSTAKRMETLDLQLHTFSKSTSEKFERSTAQRWGY